jgi:hypothetical protein
MSVNYAGQVLNGVSDKEISWPSSLRVACPGPRSSLPKIPIGEIPATEWPWPEHELKLHRKRRKRRKVGPVGGKEQNAVFVGEVILQDRNVHTRVK